MAFRRVELFGPAVSIEALNRAINVAWRDSGDDVSVRLSPSGAEPATYFGGSGTIEDWRISELPGVLARFPGSYAFLAEGTDAPIDEVMGMPFDENLRSLSGFWQCCEYLGLRRILHPDEIGLTSEASVLLLQSVVSVHGKVADGQMVQCLSIPWQAIVAEVERNPSFLPQFATQHRRFEEFLAASYERAGFKCADNAHEGVFMNTRALSPARKRPVNLTLSEDLVEQARDLTSNLSATVETLLADYVLQHSQARQSRRLEAAQTAQAWNDFNAQAGSFADEYVTL